MMNLDKLYVKYKYVKTMTIETRTAKHLLERWETNHIFTFMDAQKSIEFHLSPEYEYSGTKYFQITLDLDLSRYHKREGGSERQIQQDIRNIIKDLSCDFIIEFTGNGYRIVSQEVWADLNLDKARKIAMSNKQLYPTIDPVSSFRLMPIARVGTYNKGRRLIVPVEKSDADNFSKYKSMSKKIPSSIMSKEKWLQLFKEHWIPKKFRGSGGMKIIEKFYKVDKK